MDRDRGRCAGLAGRVVAARPGVARVVAVAARQQEAVVGRAGPVAGLAAVEVVVSRWGLARGRSWIGSTGPKWRAFCESSSCFRIPSSFVSALIVRRGFGEEVVVGTDGEFRVMLSRALRIEPAWRVLIWLAARRRITS